MSELTAFNASTTRMNFELQGFGRLKWNGTQYEFEGDTHESAKVFAEHLLHEVNAGRNRERELVEGLKSLGPLISTIKNAANINDEWGCVVIGQADAARKLHELYLSLIGGDQ